MNEFIVGLDIGGTSVKATIIDIDDPDDGICQKYFTSLAVNAALSLSYDETMQQFFYIFDRMFGIANQHNFAICGIGIATPGPFDHERGISLMRHKYKSLYEVNLKEEFRKIASLSIDFPIIFDDDCRSFLLGEAIYGEASGFSRRIGITIGTGLGAGFMVDNDFIKEGYGVPNRGQLWSLSYKEGIVEDFVSKRGIIEIYNKISGVGDVKIEVENIAKLALNGDISAKKAFMEMGKTLGEVLRPIVKDFQAECLIFGGNISRAYSLFAEGLQGELRIFPCLKKIAPARSIDLSVFYGLGYKFKTERRMSDENDRSAN